MFSVPKAGISALPRCCSFAKRVASVWKHALATYVQDAMEKRETHIGCDRGCRASQKSRRTIYVQHFAQQRSQNKLSY
jgi:hypothetical protein